MRSVSAELFPLHEPTERPQTIEFAPITLRHISQNTALGLCRYTHIIVVTTALSAEGRLVVELVLEIVLTQVPQGCADLSVLQLFLGR